MYFSQIRRAPALPCGPDTAPQAAAAPQAGSASRTGRRVGGRARSPPPPLLFHFLGRAPRAGGGSAPAAIPRPPARTGPGRAGTGRAGPGGRPHLPHHPAAEAADPAAWGIPQVGKQAAEWNRA